MRFLLSVLFFFLACSFVSGEVLFTRTAPPTGWTLGKRANPDSKIQFMLGLKQRNLAQLENKFWAVSDPKGADYQKFMSIDAILDLIAPAAEDHDRVVDWLVEYGVNEADIVSYGDAIEASASAGVIENLFDTLMYEYTNSKGETIVRNFGSLSVPSGVRKTVEMVTGISTFPVPHFKLHKDPKPFEVDATDYGIVAQTVYSLYNLPEEYVNATAALTSQGVIEFEGQNFSPTELNTYSQLVGIPISPVPAPQIVGPNNPNAPQTEAVLDIQFIATVNDQSSNWFWIEAGNNWLYAFAVHFFNTTTVPQVVSISYGWWEGAQCDINPTECSQIGVDSAGYVDRVNTEFQKIGLRGTSILVSSGDSGAHTRTDELCTAPTLRSEFPAGSPYVTAVGATQLTNSNPLATQPQICTQSGYQCSDGSGTEVAVSFQVAGFTSGGGFSGYADQPDYQADAVNAYINSGVTLPPATYYNASRRGQPDVSAVGHNNLIYQSGYIYSVGGTSASAPIFAGVIALLNEASIAKNGRPLGFLNPFLYQMWADTPEAFNDVLSGDNVCTESGCGSNCKGWYATKGWDPVTGLGTPNYPNMLKYLRTN